MRSTHLLRLQSRSANYTSSKSGRGVTLRPPAHLGTVRAIFTAHGSSISRQRFAVSGSSRRMMHRPFGPFARVFSASNLPAGSEPSQRSLGKTPAPRQRPFGLAIRPIRRVMDSPCLSAAGLRFWERPVPAEEFGLAYAWLTAHRGPHRGYRVPHD